MARNKVLVLGGNFAGLTAALAIKHDLGDDVDVTVVSASDRFLFNPSLIWLPFGKRSPADITFPVGPTFEGHEVDFVHAEATGLDLAARKVQTGAGDHAYDYLVIATGYRNDFGTVDGLGPGGNAYTITTLDDAVHAGEGWRRFLEAPGDIVVGATEGAGCFGAAYEYLFNVSHQLRKAGLKKHVGLTYVTPEPELGHFGIGGLPHGERLLGMFMRKERIASVIDTAIDHVDEGAAGFLAAATLAVMTADRARARSLDERQAARAVDRQRRADDQRRRDHQRADAQARRAAAVAVQPRFVPVRRALSSVTRGWVLAVMLGALLAFLWGHGTFPAQVVGYPPLPF